MAKTDQTSRPLASKTLRQRAEELARTSPADITGMTSNDVQRLIYESQIHQIELELQNEELRQAQVELAHSRDQYSDLYEFAPTGYVTLDSEGKVQNANLRTTTILGVERQHLLQARLSSFVCRESQDEFNLHRQAVLDSEIGQNCEVQMKVADDSVLTVHLESIAFGPENDRHCLTTLIDITRRRVAEETLRLLNIELGTSLADRTGELHQNIKMLKLLTEAVSHLGEGVLITSDELDWPGPQIVFVNNAMCQITGCTAEELIGHSPRVLQGDGSNRETLDRIKAELSAGRSVLAEVINYRKDGTPYDAELFITPLFNAEGRRTNFVSIHRDITDRIEAENALRAAHQHLEAIIETAPSLIVVTDRGGRVVHFNRACEEVTGYRRDEVLGDTVLDRFVPVRWRSEVAARFADPHAPELREPHENPWLTMTGDERLIEWRCLTLPQSDETSPWFLVGFGIDITERKRAEVALRESEARLASLIDALPVGVGFIDGDGKAVISNPQMTRYLPTGVIPSHDPSRMGRWRGTHPNGGLIEPTDFAGARALRGERVVPGIEFRYTQDDGTEVWTQVAAVPLFDDGRISGHVVVVIDIDAAKRAQERLALQARQQADIATLGEISLIGAPLQDLMDEAVQTIRDTLGNELVTVLELLPGGNRLLLRAGVGWKEGLVGSATVSAGRESQAGYTLLSGEPVVVADLAVETRFSGPSLLSEHGVASGISCPILRSGGEPYGVLATHSRSRREYTADDVTYLEGIANVLGTAVQRRILEESRWASEERLAAILNTAADAIITIDQRGIIVSANPATERMFGYAQDELVGQTVKVLMPSPYHDEHDGYLERYLQTGEARIIGIGREVVGRRKDGSSFPIGLAVSEVDHLHLFTGIIRDMSEQRKLQRDIVAIAEDEQRRIGQDLHDGTQQELIGLGMLTQVLFSNLSQASSQPPESAVDIDKCCELSKKILDGLTRAQKELQSISRGLVPIRLDPEGLMDALGELTSRTDKVHGITCAFKCEQPVKVADSLTATHLYRIAQEALTNALKHARPEHILIALESDNGRPILQVADDGIGFDWSVKAEGMGMKTMQYRASLIGASLAISPINAGGTLVTCKVFGGVRNDD